MRFYKQNKTKGMQMKIQIKRFSTHQTAKIFAILFAISTLFFLPFMALPLLFSPEGAQGFSKAFAIMLFVIPAFYFVFTYIFIRLGLWLYNKINPRFGGIEFEFEQKDL